MSRCLTWAIVGMERVECLGVQGHGGMHQYPKDPPCEHPMPQYDAALDRWYCLDCKKSWK